MSGYTLQGLKNKSMKYCSFEFSFNWFMHSMNLLRVQFHTEREVFVIDLFK